MEDRRQYTQLKIEPELESKILSILEQQSVQLDKLEAAYNKLLVAFPEGDAEGHRRYHEIVVESEKTKLAFKRSVIEKSLAALVWTLLVFLGTSVWAYVQTLMYHGKG